MVSGRGRDAGRRVLILISGRDAGRSDCGAVSDGHGHVFNDRRLRSGSVAAVGLSCCPLGHCPAGICSSPSSGSRRSTTWSSLAIVTTICVRGSRSVSTAVLGSSDSRCRMRYGHCRKSRNGRWSATADAVFSSLATAKAMTHDFGDGPTRSIFARNHLVLPRISAISVTGSRGYLVCTSAIVRRPEDERPAETRRGFGLAILVDDV